jgi:hypothetical protein
MVLGPWSRPAFDRAKHADDRESKARRGADAEQENAEGENEFHLLNGTAREPCVTGAVAGTLEVEQLAVAEIRRFRHGLCRNAFSLAGSRGLVFVLHAFGDTGEHVFCLDEGRAVSATGGLGFFRGDPPEVREPLPELVICFVWVERAIAIVFNRMVAVS